MNNLVLAVEVFKEPILKAFYKEEEQKTYSGFLGKFNSSSTSAPFFLWCFTFNEEVINVFKTLSAGEQVIISGELNMELKKQGEIKTYQPTLNVKKVQWRSEGKSETPKVSYKELKTEIEAAQK
ncbi:hypothetical protein [[Mycoplasma] anseris]|uniref:Single-stranded DNA-binding protein n=1 Tax=[Mycoplasma] anseris TaxID=92400 RepID=A0A2Z4NDN5_9BACT|nr:hypothetical protein [[Mycoplasma] anseris]AWX69702.1 hypothetical protein DP065_03025 [[Mycoplasma] anseris]